MVMTSELEAMANSLFDNIVPKNWEAVAYPSLMPLAAWVSDLVKRMDFVKYQYNCHFFGKPLIEYVAQRFSNCI